MMTYYIETFGCQMNKYDSELVVSILNNEGYEHAKHIEEADIILINTCSVREHAESRVKNRIDSFRHLKQHNQNLIICVLGCMAQRLGHRLIEEKPLIDFVIGPDGYRRLPEILDNVNNMHVGSREPLPSDDETYSEIYPTRYGNVSAWVAIMRGCNNFCSYCIVPYVRGRERSRPSQNILNEVKQLVNDGFKEVTLLGQNVNSYHDGEADFADLIKLVSQIDGIQRVRFATSHPKDLSLKLIKTITNNENICNHIHLPLQSASNKILKLMNRQYTREYYQELIDTIRKHINYVGIYTDIIIGFPGETDNDFEQTLTMIDQIQFDGVFSFKYSPREGTAAYQYEETLSDEEKQIRLQQLNQLQKEITLQQNRQLIGTIQNILIEGQDKKGKLNQLMGRTDTNKIVVFPHKNGVTIGSLVKVEIVNAEGHTLFGLVK